MLSHTDTLDSHNIGDIATPSQISVSNFTMNDLMVEDMLNFPLDLPPLEPDPLSASNRNGAQESRKCAPKVLRDILKFIRHG